MLRPQTWYLLVAAILLVVCMIAGAGTTLQLVVLIAAAVVIVITIPLFKNRKLQAGITLLSIFLLLAWYIVLALYAIPEIMHWQYVLPAVAILLVFIARKGIMHDEKVVRSYDRIR